MKAKTLEAKYEAKLEFTGGGGGGEVQNKKPSVGGSMDIFCNKTSFLKTVCCEYHSPFLIKV